MGYQRQRPCKLNRLRGPRSDLDFERVITKVVAGARNHRNLPIEILALFSEDTLIRAAVSRWLEREAVHACRRPSWLRNCVQIGFLMVAIW